MRVPGDQAANGGSRPGLAIEIYAFDRLGDRVGSDRTLAELRRIAGDGVNLTYASAHARRGEIGPALDGLDRAWQARDPWLIQLPILPSFKSLHDEPRYKAICANIDFP